MIIYFIAIIAISCGERQDSSDDVSLQNPQSCGECHDNSDDFSLNTLQRLNRLPGNASIEKTVDEYVRVKGLNLKNQEECQVIFPGGHRIDKNHTMLYEHVQQKPTVTWSYNTSLYTLFFLRIDDYQDMNYITRQTLIWAVGNIPYNDIDSGNTLYEYTMLRNPRPRENERYVFLIYCQNVYIIDFESCQKYRDPREKFVVEFYAWNHKLELPIAGNSFKLI